MNVEFMQNLFILFIEFIFRVKDLQTLGTAETKLLYTLHWILLFASEECADEEQNKTNSLEEKRPQPYLFSIPTISVHNISI